MSESPATAALPFGGRCRRLALVAMALPLGIVLVDQLLSAVVFQRGSSSSGLWLFYAWLAAKTALLAVCAGKFLGPTLYGWIVFFWGQALVDVQTFHASTGFMGHYGDGLEQSLVAAQSCFLAAWGILSNTALRWRLTCVFLAAAVVVHHGTSLHVNWHVQAMPSTLAVAAAMVTALCCGLRLAGFRIQRLLPAGAPCAAEVGLHFGVKHMLIWTAAMAPLLLVVRGFDYLAFRQMGVVDVYPMALVAAGTALAAMAAIWFSLGNRFLVVRLVVLMLTIAGASLALDIKTFEWHALFGNYPQPHAVRLAVCMRPLWMAWFVLVSALTTAMFAFLWASGFRLARRATVNCDVSSLGAAATSPGR